MAAADEFDFVIHNGDISYADNKIASRTKPGVAPSIYNDWMDVYYANISVRMACATCVACTRTGASVQQCCSRDCTSFVWISLL